MSVRIQINLSRKISQNFNSTNVSVGVETEVRSSIGQEDELLAEIGHLFHLVETAIDQEFSALNGESGKPVEVPAPSPAPAPNGQPEVPSPASDKQISFLGTLFRRAKMNQKGVQEHMTQILGSFIPVNELSKRDAARLIESLTQTERN